MTEPMDTQLVEMSQKGSQQAFSQLVCRYQKRIFTLCLRLLDDFEEARDMTQETFIKAFKYIKKFRQEAQFSTWLYYIALNTCRNKLRSWKGKPNVISVDETIEMEDNQIPREIEDKSSPDPLRIAESLELQHQVQTALNDLSLEHKEVIVMRDIQGFTYEEIAEALQCNLGTVKSRIARARIQLKDKLKEVMPDEFKNTCL